MYMTELCSGQTQTGISLSKEPTGCVLNENYTVLMCCWKEKSQYIYVQSLGRAVGTGGYKNQTYTS